MNSIVHVIPSEDEMDRKSSTIDTWDSPSCSSMKSSTAFVRSASSVLVLDHAIEDLRKAAYVTCASASNVIKREALQVNKRLTAYHKNSQKRSMQRKIRKHLALPNIRTIGSIPDYIESRGLGDESSTTHHCVDNEQQQHRLSDASTSFLSSSSNQNHEKELENFDNEETVGDDYAEQTSIMNQAHRMKVMAILLRSIEANQRLLLREMMECKKEAESEERLRI